VIWIEKRLRRRIADHVNSGLTVFEKVSDLLIRSSPVSFAGEFPLDPRGIGVRVRQPTASEGKFSRPLATAVRRNITTLQRHPRPRFHAHGA
jgi:hypothetical protein